MRIFLALLTCCVIATVAVVWFASPHLPDYVERRGAVINGRGVEFLVVDLGAENWQWSIMNNPDEPKSVAAWRESTGADIVFNGAYFGENFAPSGYFSVDGEQSTVPWPSTEQQREKGSYSFLVRVHDGEVSLAYLPDAPQGEPTDDAFLSFPTLLASGQPIVSEDSYRTAARTILAEDELGRDFLILTESGGVTLYEASRWLAEQPENFVTAGNLDGGPSTGVSVENGIFDIELESAPVPSIFVLRKRD